MTNTTKLLDADKVNERLDTLATIWYDNEDVLFVLENIQYMVGHGAFDAPEELQPKPPRQTLAEALEGAEVGTRFRHKRSGGTSWAVLSAAGRTYSSMTGKEGRTTDRYKADGGIKYADEFIIEYPTY